MRRATGWFGRVVCWLWLWNSCPAQSIAPDTTQPAPESTYAIIAEVRIAGNRLTKPFVILREMDLHPGDTLQLATLAPRLKANAQRIFNTRLFVRTSVTVDSTLARPNRLRLLVTVKENWYLWPAPYVRLNDRNFNEWLDRGTDLSRLNYGMYVGHTNLFGRMQRLEAMGDIGFATRLMLCYNVGHPRRGELSGPIQSGLQYPRQSA
jgi:hypothetical protein